MRQQRAWQKNRMKRRPLAEINVVPYIDVMLVLLVIFMITAPLLTQGVAVKLPQANANAISNELHSMPIIVSVDGKGRYYLNVSDNPALPMAAQDLAVRVAAQLAVDRENHRRPLVLVKGDKKASYGQVVSAMVLLQHAGVTDVGLMTEQPTKSTVKS